MKTALFTLALAIAAAGFAASSSAQQTGADPIAECRAAHAADAQARINCLEQAIARMQGRVVEAEQQAAQAQQQAAAQQPQASGRPGWSLPGFRTQQDSEEREEVRVQITRVRYTGDGYGLFTTADGKVWRETVAAPSRRRLDADETYEATIHRSMFGFRMNVDGIRWEYKIEPLN
ncbi:MAG TPA: hypothetical protein PLK37_04350 [Terricaulis sp.]|nr:hypothetical protein [Terricaulis sp.]